MAAHRGGGGDADPGIKLVPVWFNKPPIRFDQDPRPVDAALEELRVTFGHAVERADLDERAFRPQLRDVSITEEEPRRRVLAVSAVRPLSVAASQIIVLQLLPCCDARLDAADPERAGQLNLVPCDILHELRRRHIEVGGM